jgi:CMP-N-acetylneuraminic acid synthetase
MRRQDLKPDAYIRSGSIYALKRDHLMLEGRRFGSENSRPYILPPERAVNVDTEIDFLIAERLMEESPRPHIKAKS